MGYSRRTRSNRVNCGVVGTTTPGTAVFPIAATTLLTTVTTSSVCAFVLSSAFVKQVLEGRTGDNPCPHKCGESGRCSAM